MHHIWTNGEMTISDRTHNLYTAGPDGDPVLLKEVYDGNGNKIWEKVNKAVGFQFVFLAGTSYFQVAGTGLSYTIDNGTPIDILDSSSLQRVNVTLTEKSIIEVNGNIINFSFSSNKCLYAVLTPFPATMSSVTRFDYCFQNCTSLQSIPAGLFDNCTAVTSFSYCFDGCTSLQSIPAGLFDNCPAVTTFDSCFNFCNSLQSIPAGLFDNCTAVTGFAFCFYNGRHIQSIPAGLFDNCTAVTSFSYCFGNFTSLQSIPAGLFDNCTAVTGFASCFYNCTNLTGNAPALWLRTNPTPAGTACFRNCSRLSNYADIPSSWK